MDVHKNIFIVNKISLLVNMAGWMFRRIVRLFRVSNALNYFLL